jgi:UDP-3-O-[3-hydroxymyristoyl] glucosamine N-acyltransferase
MAGAYVDESADVADSASIMANAFVAPGAKVGGNSVVYPGSYIGHGSSVGDDCTIYPNVTIRDGVSVGNRVTIHPGSVIGGDGFGYATDKGVHHKIPQVGGVVIGDDVEIGANSTIDRGALDDTVIKRGTKIDNLVMIAHNVKVGEDCLLVAQVGISGSSELGHHVVIGGQAGVVGHIKVGDYAQIAGKSGVSKNLTGGKNYAGVPVMPHKDWLKSMVLVSKLPEMKKELDDLNRKIKALEGED